MSRKGDDVMGELRPATVEELAAQERLLASSRRALSARPIIIALATSCLLIAGAGAFALARTGPNATMVQPYGLDAPFGVGYVDGFGEHTPKPSRTPASSSSRSKRPSPAPSASPSAASEDVVILTAPDKSVSAVHWTKTRDTSYETYVWVHNEGVDAVAWEVRVRLQAGATVSSTMAVQKSYVDGQWIFKPSRGGLLPGGRVYLFAFSGTKPSGRFSLRSCTVNGLTCTPYS